MNMNESDVFNTNYAFVLREVQRGATCKKRALIIVSVVFN